jgi:hypothetical protein
MGGGVEEWSEYINSGHLNRLLYLTIPYNIILFGQKSLDQIIQQYKFGHEYCEHASFVQMKICAINWVDDCTDQVQNEDDFSLYKDSE